MIRTAIAQLLVSAAVLLASHAVAAPLTDAEQACVNALNETGVTVARAQANLTDACLDPAGPGSAADVPGCVANDADPGFRAATLATFDAAVAACGTPPGFGVAPTFDQGVNVAATTHVRGLFADAFGSSAGGAHIADVADTKGRRCQGGVVKGMEGIVSAYLARFGHCVDKALAKGAENADALAACNMTAAKGSVVKARKKLASQARRRCKGTTTAILLPGVCAGSGTASTAVRCLGARAVCRACRVANAMDGLDADCDLVDDGADNGSCTFLVRVSGDAIPFDNGPDGRIEGADISLVEHPERHVTTGPDGHFVFDGLEEGSEATLVLSHPNYHAIQTATITLGPQGLDRLTFQAVTFDIYDVLGALLGVMPDEVNRCQMVTTVTRVGKSIYNPGAHGEQGVTVTLDPPLEVDHGPIYFNSSVLPDRALVQTSDDGGVLFIQVPPGEYVWTAHKTGAVFSRVKMTCRVGLLVNASPPRGLQRH